jgi:hypothetical protein
MTNYQLDKFDTTMRELIQDPHENDRPPVFVGGWPDLSALCTITRENAPASEAVMHALAKLGQPAHP